MVVSACEYGSDSKMSYAPSAKHCLLVPCLTYLFSKGPEIVINQHGSVSLPMSGTC